MNIEEILSKRVGASISIGIISLFSFVLGIGIVVQINALPIPYQTVPTTKAAVHAPIQNPTIIPTISMISPMFGPPGATFTISGQGFTPTSSVIISKEANTLPVVPAEIHTISAQFLNSSSLSFTLPNPINEKDSYNNLVFPSRGYYDVQVKNSLGSSLFPSSAKILITRIASITPLSGKPGSKVTITFFPGFGINPKNINSGNPGVQFGQEDNWPVVNGGWPYEMSITSISSDNMSLTFKIPAKVKKGIYSVDYSEVSPLNSGNSLDSNIFISNFTVN